MNRADFQQLADVRIEEAGILLTNGKPDGAYYLAGYAVECALKACIAKLTNLHDFPDKQFAQRCFTHNIEELIGASDLRGQRDADVAVDADLKDNWLIVKDWTESSRYLRKTQSEAQALFDAVADPSHGVLSWIKQRW